MQLSDDEALHAAQTLCETDTDLKWSQLSEAEKQVYIQLVRDLAAMLHVPKSESALKIFYAWMGEKT